MCIDIHYITYTCKIRERITVSCKSECQKGNGYRVHDMEEGMRDGWMFSGVLHGM